MRTKSTADPDKGVKERLTCPAGGPNPTAICALKPRSEKPRPTKQANNTVVDVRRKINHSIVMTDGHPPAVCSQETITLTPEDGAKFRQTMDYGSEKHTSTYYRLRSSQEGVHGSAKDAAGVALANAGRRRVHGWAAQQLFAAFLLAETATRRIRLFIFNAVNDRNGDLYVERRLYASPDKNDPTKTVPDPSSTGSPPGAPPPGEDPDRPTTKTA